MNSQNITKVVDKILSAKDVTRAVESIIYMLPDRVFYYPELQTRHFRGYQMYLNELIDEVKYQKPMTALVTEQNLRRKYPKDSLLCLAGSKRRLLILGILMQEQNERKELLLKMIDEHSLQNRVIALGECL
ncbi:hypothetical protein [Streptococcus sp. zg-JUN1979]|uniref:hypothetical protein n=1 Tax=Streptococcus sp. zg-JUN1979 TaxID=3391450 RepID=UPI0039A479A3